jgi:hypothetical protein
MPYVQPHRYKSVTENGSQLLCLIFLVIASATENEEALANKKEIVFFLE